METPQATAGVRGTVFTVIYDREAAGTTVATVEGAVAVVEKREAGAQIEVPALRQTSLDPATTEPPKVQRIAATLVDAWKMDEADFERLHIKMEKETPRPTPRTRTARAPAALAASRDDDDGGPGLARVLLVVLGTLGGLLGVGFVVLQLGFPAAPGGEAKLAVVKGPQGLPRPQLTLASLEGLTWRHSTSIGCSLNSDLKLVDERLGGVHCHVVRRRFGRWMRTELVVRKGCVVLVDGVQVAPGAHRLEHMARLRMGEEYEVQYDAGGAPVPVEVLCRDGRYMRGRPRDQHWADEQAIVLHSLEPGGRPQTVPFAQVEQVRCFRTPQEDRQKRGLAGIDWVGGPLTQVRFHSGRIVSGRLGHAEDMESGRFPIFTSETRGLDHILIVGDVIARIRVQHGTETEPKAQQAPEHARGRALDENSELTQILPPLSCERNES